ncbi:Alpha crystallin/Hsp20 domain [Macleaya cordata]|uniref:Alpha crystallin/Hsp20 domain n=1 Tax=Macleaya cordata TaxID=56857 RepID=A0A200PXY5_MACCD|nr:Alpha crystallin/Hsp20 domain [Macleaya cordata]
MASSIALRRAAAAPYLLNRFLNPTRSASVLQSSISSFNNNAQMRNLDEDERSMDIDRRSSDSVSRRRDSSPNLFSDVFDPFSPSRSLSQLFNMMDSFMENPFVNPSSRGMVAGGLRRGWDAKEDEDALYMKIDMPGLGKEDVKVSVEQNTLIIKGEGQKENDDEESVRRYSSRIDLPPKFYKLDQVRAEMKNGVLRVCVPKVKEEERKDVHQVQVE